VSVRLHSRTREREADEVASANYEALKEEVLRSVAGRLRSRGITTMISQDLDVAYNEGWQGVTQHIIQGRPVTSLAGLLYTMTLRRAIDIYRGKQERRRVDMDLDLQGVEVDLAERADERETLARVFGRVKERLNERERRAVTLCLLHGYRRPEAADLLDVDRVVFERTMDGAMRKLSGIVSGIQARGCGGDEWSRLMRAYALGLLAEDGIDYRRAHEHVEGPEACEACRRYVRGLRGLAAVLPPLLPPGLLEGHEAGGVLVRLAEWLGGGHGAGSAALQGAGAAGGSSASGVLSVVASRGTAGKMLISVIAVLSIAGATMIATHRATAHAHAHHHMTPPPQLITPSVGLASNDGTFAWPAVVRHGSPGITSRRRLAARTPVRPRWRPAATETPAEFSFETPAEQTPARMPETAVRRAPRLIAHSPAPWRADGGESEGSEFGFEP
jgi:DNA-directed RNA polymerase specialized sigma24 family protein